MRVAGWELLSNLAGWQIMPKQRQRCLEALHTDDLALTALRQLFIRPLKEHKQVICEACVLHTVFLLFVPEREKKQEYM